MSVSRRRWSYRICGFTKKIIVRYYDESYAPETCGVKVYDLEKFQKSNQNSCYNQIPIVKIGDKISKRQILVDGPCIKDGELALGKNLIVAFMPGVDTILRMPSCCLKGA